MPRFMPYGPWQRLGLRPKFYLYLVLGIALVLAVLWGGILWRRPDLWPIFLDLYLPIGLILLGFVLAGVLFAIWLERKLF